jgi:hypothetical protein
MDAVIGAAIVVACLIVWRVAHRVFRRRGFGGAAAATEGFAAAPVQTSLGCPAGYTFFNDSHGASFCCKGKVNPYSHTCEATAPNTMCAFQPKMKDPRGSGLPTLPLCAAIVDQVNRSAAETFCPRALSNYATVGKCCASGTDAEGRDCSPLDLADKQRYCVIGTPAAGERSCANMRLAELGACPTGLQKITYALGEREARRYGPAVIGTEIPVCFGMDATCIPDEAITELQKQGIYRDKTNLRNWAYSSSGYKRLYVDRDLTGDEIDRTYV